MSTPASQSATSVHPSRQQLDELEALMQRMLDLPVNQLDADSGNGVAGVAEPDDVERDPTMEWAEDHLPSSVEWLPSPLDQAVHEEGASTKEQTMAEWPAPLPPPEWPDLAEYTPDAVLAEQPLGEASEAAWPDDAEALPLNGIAEDSREKAPATAAAKTSLAVVTVPAMPPGAGRPWPLVWINIAFDGLTVLLGPLGRWLRGPTGRAMIGWIGVLLLAGAMSWALFDWMGWTW